MILIDALSHAEKLDLNVLFATSLTKSGKGKSAPVVAVAVAEAAAEGGAVKADKPKRVMSFMSEEQRAKMKAWPLMLAKAAKEAKAAKDAAGGCDAEIGNSC